MTENMLWYKSPAQAWTDALPLGNGRLGAMVYGGVGREELQLNEATLWSGGPYDPANPNALPNLDETRRLIFEGRFEEAEKLAQDRLLSIPYRQMSFQPAGNIFLDFNHEPIADTYRRQLDIGSAIATTTYRLLGTGLEPDPAYFTREAFVSAADDVIALRISSSQPATLSFELWLDSPQPGDLIQSAAGRLVYEGRNFSEHNVPAQLEFGIDVDVRLDGGTIERRGRRLVVRNATSAVIIVDIATSFRRFNDVSGDFRAAIATRRNRIAGKSYDDLKQDHIAEHKRLFDRLTITTGSGRDDLPTDDRIANYAGGGDPGLAALYVRYGRYLMITSSRKGTLPANLQGVWNKDTQPAWGSKWTCNINLQMNYWLPDPANLGECVEPYIELMEDVAETGAKMARDHYGARGWVLHHNTDIWCAAGPVDGAKYGVWPTGGAWCCAQLWDHAVYQGRPEALVRRLMPLIEGAVRFALDVLQPLPGTDHLVTNPTIAPENVHPFGAAICAGAAMDNQILRDLFDAYLAAAEQLGIEDDMVAHARDARIRLPEDRIGASGQLQEWLEDWDMDVPEIHHRHISHLYGLHPSGQISLRGTPELAAAARRTLEIRGDDATGWGIGWRACFWARLGEAERAAELLKKLLHPSRSYRNLFDVHPPFQIDGNFGGAAAILEMLVQSTEDHVWLLPACPEDWDLGRLHGTKVKGDIEIDLDWCKGMVTRVVLRSNKNQSRTIRMNGNLLQVDLEAGAPFLLPV